MVALDATEDVIDEAIRKGCNLVVAHHPIIFSGLKSITGKNYVERTIITAIQKEVAIYAIHTNLDNVMHGVNHTLAERMGLKHIEILQPRTGLLKKLYTFVPQSHAEQVKSALFAAGAGHIGNYDECSFSVEGAGTFRGLAGSQPFVGQTGVRHTEREEKIEVIFPAWLEKHILSALLAAHPYEEVAYDIVRLDNAHHKVGAGVLGELEMGMSSHNFLQHLKNQFQLSVIRHTLPPEKPIRKVAVCGGAGSFLIKTALAAGAEAFVTADIKYHDFFDAEGKMLLCDIGHWESEQFTIELLATHIAQKFPNFAVLKTGVQTNPVRYFT